MVIQLCLIVMHVLLEIKKYGQVVVNVSMAKNKMFPLEVSSVNYHALGVSKKNESVMWHLRYGHLNNKGLELLKTKKYDCWPSNHRKKRSSVRRMHLWQDA